VSEQRPETPNAEPQPNFSISPLPEHERVGGEDIGTAARDMIRSVSGWRSVFADRPDSHAAAIATAKRYVCAAAAVSFGGLVKDTGGKRVVVARDTRPTGATLADICVRVFLGMGLEVDLVGIAAAPEAVAYTAAEASADALCYVTASHNPVGFNGFKWCENTGEILCAERARELSRRFDDLCARSDLADSLRSIVRSPEAEAVSTVYDQRANVKETALAAYEEFVTGIVTEGNSKPDEWFSRFERTDVVADFNGGARAAGIDRRFLQRLQVTLHLLNDTPGKIAHEVLPEGEALYPCRDELLRLAPSKSGLLLGYVTDNDGDRGNLVFLEERRGADAPSLHAHSLPAQEVFALAVVAQLSWAVSTDRIRYGPGGVPVTSSAIVVNGATSLRVEEIAERFGVSVVRAEVGEANILAAAEKARAEGLDVIVMGEGSNGGTIIPPSTIRDPICTVAGVIRLVAAPPVEPERQGAATPGRSRSPFQVWLSLGSGRPLDVSGPDGGSRAQTAAPGGGAPTGGGAAPGADVRTDTPAETKQAIRPLDRLGECRGLLPPACTTGTGDPEAVIDIGEVSHAGLKAAYERLLPDAWKELPLEVTEDLSVTAYRIVNHEGREERPGAGNRTGDHSGGFTVRLLQRSGQAVGFVWMRGSRTEPVFRVLADVKGDKPQLERSLLRWHRALIRKACRLASEDAASRSP